MKRRDFLSTLVAASAALCPLDALAQPASKVPRIGYLSGAVHLREAFLQGLRDLGYVEGRNVDIVIRDPQGRYERLAPMAAELVAHGVDVIVVTSTPSTLVAKKATQTIPIVFTWAVDPVESGLVASLARPGGNVTGLSTQAPETVGKRLELLKEAVPGVSRIAVLWHPGDYGERTERNMLDEVAEAARALKLGLQVVEARGPDDFERAFAEMAGAGAEAVTVQSTNVFFVERKRLVNLMAKNRLPAVYLAREFVDAGGLMSYAPNNADLHRRAAAYVDKILKGAKPADLPVEQPTRFELVINLKTATALGLTIPHSVLLRADEVIE